MRDVPAGSKGTAEQGRNPRDYVEDGVASPFRRSVAYFVVMPWLALFQSHFQSLVRRGSAQTLFAGARRLPVQIERHKNAVRIDMVVGKRICQNKAKACIECTSRREGLIGARL
jgi:hypothetical protein